MNITGDVSKLKTNDIFSIALFLLYKMRDVPEYSTLSELCYVLDKDSLISLCEFFGGTTIKVPTIDELKVSLYALSLYQTCKSDSGSLATKLSTVPKQYRSQVKSAYYALSDIMAGFSVTNE